MTVTIHSPFHGPPTISREGFIAVLERTGSFDSEPLWGPFPRAARPDVAYQCYDLIVEYRGPKGERHDPARWLAIGGKEHTFGTNEESVLWRNNTRSISNARSIRHPEIKGEIITDSYRRSEYAKYQDIRDSILDGMYRIDEPGFAYRQANAISILENIEIFAPGNDGNRPREYSQTMVDWMNQWAAEFPVEQEPPMVDSIRGIPLRVSFIPVGNSNRPRHSMNPEWITVHETGNPNRGANAEMHRRYVNNGGGPGNVSWHYTVDDKEIVQHLPLNENGWHAGDGGNGTGNRRSIGIEMCINSDGNWGRTMGNTAKLVAWLLDEREWHMNKVVQHNHWSGKNCPANMRASGGKGWRDLRTMIIGERGEQPEPDPPSNELVINGKRVIGGMKGRYEALGDLALPTLGMPRTEEFKADVDGVERTCQIWERAVTSWYPENQPHGVPPSNPMHIRCLTLAEAQDVVEQAMKQGVL